MVFFSGGLAKNGLTTSLFNLLANLDTSKKNYYITFRASAVKPNQEMLLQLPEGVGYIATKGKVNLNLFKKVLWVLVKLRKFPVGWMMKILKKDLQLEMRRHYGTADIHTLVHFTGYDDSTILKYSAFENNSVIYVHSDMTQEVNVRKIQRKDVLEYAYANYDKVAMVTEDIREATNTFVKQPKQLYVAHNLIDYKGIRERGEQELAFDEYTRCNKTFEEVRDIINSPAKKLVNVGRFSPEKGHQRLIDSFAKVLKEEPNAYLFIIGGNQFKNSYAKLCDYVKGLPCADHVVLILSMSNPLPLVKACDGFVLSSFYEGFGLVLAEADILGIPVVSTDIVGPRLFMQKYGGVLVPSSKPGIEEGIRKLIKGEVKPLTVDYAEYNKNAVEEFEALLVPTEE
ncbi:MAG: glycosyltransferase [Clostridia bacterium]|nr:glycosyltransferase [Clostridia bacterium]